MSNIEGLINKAIEEVSLQIMDDAESKANQVTNRVDYSRKTITDILMSYADKDGFIPKKDIKKVLRELDYYNEEFQTIIEDGLEEQTKDSASKINKVVIGVLVAQIGLSAFKGKKTDVMDEEEFQSLLWGYLKSNSVQGLTVFDRVTRYAGLLRDRMQEAIRYGILSGQKFTKISLSVKKEVDKRLSQVKTIITTEIPNILRKGVSLIAGKLDIVKGVKIIDYRGRHANHKSHMCYKYAEADKYGMGKGIYKLSDTYILNPHPQCTAYFEYVLDKDKMKGIGDEDAE